MSSEVEAVLNSEVIDEVDKLIDEEIDVPESWRLLPQMGGFSVTKLIIENDRNIVFGCQLCKWDEIVVDQSWTAVQYDKRHVLSVLQVSKALEVRLEGFAVMMEVDLSVDIFDGVGSCGHGGLRHIQKSTVGSERKDVNDSLACERCFLWMKKGL